MTGDFLALLQKNSFPSVTLSGGNPLALEATTVFAFHCAEGVIIGDHGEIQGDISARSVVVGGKVTGNIHATESLELLAKSQVFGDLHAPQLLIAEGAIFEGSCLMASEKAKVIEMDVNG